MVDIFVMKSLDIKIKRDTWGDVCKLEIKIKIVDFKTSQILSEFWILSTEFLLAVQFPASCLPFRIVNLIQCNWQKRLMYRCHFYEMDKSQRINATFFPLLSLSLKNFIIINYFSDNCQRSLYVLVILVLYSKRCNNHKIFIFILLLSLSGFNAGIQEWIFHKKVGYCNQNIWMLFS